MTAQDKRGTQAARLARPRVKVVWRCVMVWRGLVLRGVAWWCGVPGGVVWCGVVWCGVCVMRVCVCVCALSNPSGPKVSNRYITTFANIVISRLSALQPWL